MVPFPSTTALRRGVLLGRLLRHTALLAVVPFPATRRALLVTLRGRRRVRLATVGQAARFVGVEELHVRTLLRARGGKREGESGGDEEEGSEAGHGKRSWALRKDKN